MSGVARVTTVSLVATLSLACWAATASANDVQLEAFSGEPFGVGKMTVYPGKDIELFPDSPIQLIERQGRVLYPAFQRKSTAPPAEGKSSEARSVTAYFLFRGTEPLEMDLRAGGSHRKTVEPVTNDEAHNSVLKAWWEQYTGAANEVANSDTYQPLVENYLISTLARRLKLDVPEPTRAWSPVDNVDEIFALLTGAESVRLAAQSKVLLEGTEDREKADQPLPRPVSTPPVNLPKAKANVAIEPIAMHVPEECFYVRCGSFRNFLWLRSAIDGWGTNVRDIVSVRGLDFRIGPRIERQLALRQTVLSKLFGDTVVSDVVILGTDTFLKEGPAIGILFEARSSTALGLQIKRQRDDALKNEEDAKEQTVRIAGRDVSLLSTPEGRVRSFHAIDGKYHLVTTSRTIVRRFFEAGAGRGSLGGLKEFRWARSTMPLSQQHTAFVYLSDPFFREVIGPHYRIEMTRRVRAAAEIDVVRLAQLAARAEGKPARRIRRLVARGMLPADFGRRPDGSHVVVSDNRVIDSLRGAYGSFLPVPDVEITAATPSEVKSYRQFASRYASYWRRMDPVIVGIMREELPGGKKERVTFDVHITPYARAHYGMIDTFLQPADKKVWTRAPGDVGSLQFNLQGQKYAAGLRDYSPQFTIKNGAITHRGPDEREVPFYLLMPKDSPLFGHVKITDPPDEDGDLRVDGSVLPLADEAWARDLTDWYLFAQKKQLLAAVAPHVKLVDAERSAKGRLWIGDLAETKLAAPIAAESYIRARKVSGGNVALMDTLSQQLHVPARRAKSVAEELLNAQLVCPLGGSYELKRSGSQPGRWRSTAWRHESLYQETSIPEGFRAPLFDWYAGLLIELNIDRDTLSTHIELDVRTSGN